VFSPFVAEAELVTVLKILRQFGSGYQAESEERGFMVKIKVN
jgi:hypothetical protein